MQHMNDNIKHVADIASGLTVVGTLTAWLPPIAAALSIIWTILRLYEMISGKSVSINKQEKENGKVQ